MKIFKIILKGFSLRSLKLAAYAWLYNIFLSLIVYFSFYMVFSISAGKSMITEKINIYGTFTSLLDIFNNFPGSFLLVTSIFFYLLILYIISSIFVSSGIFSVLMEEEKATFFTLFSASIENFWKFLKVFLINILNFTFALLPLLFIVLVFWKTLERSLNETLFGVFVLVFLTVAVLLLILSVSIYDYSRIIRLKEGRNFLYSFHEGMRFVFRNKRSIISLFFFYLISTVFTYFVFKIFVSVVEGFIGIILMFFLYQIFILFRYLLKIVIINGEFELIRTPFPE